MMDNVTYYDPVSGKILAMYSGTMLEAMDEIYSGADRVDGEYRHETHYVLDGEVTERPSSPVTRTGLILSDVPTGSTLYINGESYEAEGEVELEFPLPGAYQLRVEHFPYLDFTDEVTV